MKKSCFCAALLATMVAPGHSMADDRICFYSIVEAGSHLFQTIAEYRVSFNQGETAFLTGQTCYIEQEQLAECAASTAALTATDGQIEILFNGSNKLTHTGVGDIYAFSIGYAEIDPTTFMGKITSLSHDVFSQSVNPSVESGSIRVSGCPKLTQQDKDNIALRKKFIRQAKKMKLPE